MSAPAKRRQPFRTRAFHMGKPLIDLDNAAGTLGTLKTGLQCNFSGNAWVGCCQ